MKILLALAASLALAAGYVGPDAATPNRPVQQRQAAFGAEQATLHSDSMVAVGLSRRPQQTSASESVTACANGVAVPEPQSNQGLVQDCAVLLAARDALAGDAELNWSADRAIRDWRGVWVVPGIWGSRVVALELPLSGLAGTIPSGLGGLTDLTELNLRGNKLTGAIPAELGALEMLQTLDLAANRLTGAIPSELGGLAYLDELSLTANQLTGVIPPAVGALTDLGELNLSQNQLKGTIPG